MGGEKLKQRMCSTAIAGSPPRGRGKDKLNVREDFAPGITPAWAGKRPGSDQRPALPQDHPRVGGEKHRDPFAHAAVSGSPPRGRGKVIDFSTAQYRSRITPAWAGKRGLILNNQSSCKDHPRVGGEKGAHPEQSEFVQGSPPRGRGKVSCSLLGLRRKRITPAWAGKSRECRDALTSEWDHPRVGGEKTKKIP